MVVCAKSVEIRIKGSACRNRLRRFTKGFGGDRGGGRIKGMHLRRFRYSGEELRGYEEIHNRSSESCCDIYKLI